MKLILIILALIVATAIGYVIYQSVSVTEPYIISPISTLPAPEGSTIGHTIDIDTRTLRVCSSNAVVVVADPGVSFLYEVLWIVAMPRAERLDNLVEYTYKLPEYAKAEHINPLGSEIPDDIAKVAAGCQWK